MKKRFLLIGLVALASLVTACDRDALGSDVNNVIDEFDSFDLSAYDAQNALEALNEIGYTDYGYEITILSRNSISSDRIVDDELVHEERTDNVKFTIGQVSDLKWAYAEYTANDSATKVGVAYNNNNIYSYSDNTWSVVSDEQLNQVTNYYTEALNEMVLPTSELQDLQVHGRGPENVTIAGRKCAKYYLDATATGRTATAYFVFDIDTSLLLSFSVTNTTTTDVESTTTTNSIDVTGFSIMPTAPSLPNA